MRYDTLSILVAFLFTFLTGCLFDSEGLTAHVDGDIVLKVPEIPGLELPDKTAVDGQHVEVQASFSHSGLTLEFPCMTTSELCEEHPEPCVYYDKILAPTQIDWTTVATLDSVPEGTLTCEVGDVTFPDNGQTLTLKNNTAFLNVLPPLECALGSSALDKGFVDRWTTLAADEFWCDCAAGETPLGELEVALAVAGGGVLQDNGDIEAVGPDPIRLNWTCSIDGIYENKGNTDLPVAEEPVVTLDVQPPVMTRAEPDPYVQIGVTSLAPQTTLSCNVGDETFDVVLDTSSGTAEHTHLLGETVLATPVGAAFDIQCTANVEGWDPGTSSEEVTINPLDVWGTCIEPASQYPLLFLEPIYDLELGFAFRFLIRADPLYSGRVVFVESEYQYIAIDLAGTIVTVTARGRKSDGSHATTTMTAAISSEFFQEVRFVVDLTGTSLDIDGEVLQESAVPLGFDTLEGLDWSFTGVTRTEVASILFQRGRIADDAQHPLNDPCPLGIDGNCWDFTGLDAEKLVTDDLIIGPNGEVARVEGTWYLQTCE